MADKPNRLAPGGQHPVRHGLGFLASGGTAFAVDALVLELLTVLLGVHPIAARLVAISLAMIAGWLMHRTFTPGHGAAGRARRLLGRGHDLRLSRHALCRVPAAQRRGLTL
jgi:hypothetical protein